MQGFEEEILGGEGQCDRLPDVGLGARPPAIPEMASEGGEEGKHYPN